jgi:hypothetical protein
MGEEKPFGCILGKATFTLRQNKGGWSFVAVNGHISWTTNLFVVSNIARQCLTTNTASSYTVPTEWMEGAFGALAEN